MALMSLSAGCAPHEEAEALRDARTGVSEVIALVEEGEMTEARERFSQTDAPLHKTASLVEPMNPETAEVVNDITEYLKGRLALEIIDREGILDTAGRALAWLETAHLDLDS